MLRATLLVAAFSDVIWGNTLFDPASGPLAPYGGGAPEARQYGMVSRWPVGIFIAGSTLEGINGVYTEIAEAGDLPLHCHKAYREPDTSWSIGICATERAFYDPVSDGTEWVIFDEKQTTRFATEGASYIPGAGTAWRHISRPLLDPPYYEGTNVITREAVDGHWKARTPGRIVEVNGPREHPLTLQYNSAEGKPIRIRTQVWRVARDATKEHAVGRTIPDATPGYRGRWTPTDDEAYGELPWQVISLMDPARVEELLRQKRAEARVAEVRRARLTAEAHNSGSGAAAEGSEPPPDVRPVPAAAVAACHAGEVDKAREILLAASLEAERGGRPWERAVLQTALGACLRMNARSEEAVGVLVPLVWDFPRYSRAVVELALARLDSGDATRAVEVLEGAVYKGAAAKGVASNASVQRWMLIAHARTRHQGRGYVTRGFAEDDEVVMLSDYEQYWSRGDHAKVLTMGHGTAPVLIQVMKNGEKINVYPEHMKQAVDAIAGEVDAGGRKRMPEVPPVPPSATHCDAYDAMGDDYYRALRVPCDTPASSLRKAFRTASRVTHPDAGGSCSSRASFERVSSAHTTLSDEAKRHAYDTGSDLIRPEGPRSPSLSERVQRRYFPKADDFHPFGDPRSDSDSDDGGERKRAAEKTKWARLVAADVAWRAELLPPPTGRAAESAEAASVNVGECGGGAGAAAAEGSCGAP